MGIDDLGNTLKICLLVITYYGMRRMKYSGNNRGIKPLPPSLKICLLIVSREKGNILFRDDVRICSFIPY